MSKTTDPIIKAKLAQLAASAEVTRLKVEQGQHWEGELLNECRQMQGIINEIVTQLLRKD